MSATIWASGYTPRDECFTHDGERAAAATKDGTSPLEVYFRRSTTHGTVWSATAPDGTAYPKLVGNLGSSSTKTVSILQEHDTPRLLVSNGVDKSWDSTDMGRTWTAL